MITGSQGLSHNDLSLHCCPFRRHAYCGDNGSNGSMPCGVMKVTYCRLRLLLILLTTSKPQNCLDSSS